MIAIGPMPMMRAVCELTRPYGIQTMVSMNPIMIDGTGMCGGCRLTVGGETKFACVDGPEFDGHLVDFDEAMKRSAHVSGPRKSSAWRSTSAISRGRRDSMDSDQETCPPGNSGPEDRGAQFRARFPWVMTKKRPWRRRSAVCIAKTAPACPAVR